LAAKQHEVEGGGLHCVPVDFIGDQRIYVCEACRGRQVARVCCRPARILSSAIAGALSRDEFHHAAAECFADEHVCFSILIVVEALLAG